jgi:hypothetical protein
MSTLNFEPADEQASESPDCDDTGCQCPPGDNQYLLEIEEGQAVLVHAACGKGPSYTWGDFQDLIVMSPIPVTVEWERECDGSPWHGLDRCDCDEYVVVEATSLPEDVRSDALALSRKHAAEETHVVADDSDDPEHVDDCPGCEAFTLTGHRATSEDVS